MNQGKARGQSGGKLSLARSHGRGGWCFSFVFSFLGLSGRRGGCGICKNGYICWLFRLVEDRRG